MTEIQFGSLSFAEFSTLVRSRFTELGLMEGEPIPEETFSEAGMDVADALDLLDDYDLALSPGALARELQQLNTAAEAMG